MQSVNLYPMMIMENKFLGLETIDFLALLLAYLFVFLISKHLGINVIVVAGVYFLLKGYKWNKPPRHTERVLRFLILPQWYTQCREVI